MATSTCVRRAVDILRRKRKKNIALLRRSSTPEKWHRFTKAQECREEYGTQRVTSHLFPADSWALNSALVQMGEGVRSVQRRMLRAGSQRSWCYIKEEKSNRRRKEEEEAAHSTSCYQNNTITTKGRLFPCLILIFIITMHVGRLNHYHLSFNLFLILELAIIAFLLFFLVVLCPSKKHNQHFPVVL